MKTEKTIIAAILGFFALLVCFTLIRDAYFPAAKAAPDNRGRHESLERQKEYENQMRQLARDHAVRKLRDSYRAWDKEQLRRAERAAQNGGW